MKLIKFFFIFFFILVSLIEIILQGKKNEIKIKGNKYKTIKHELFVRN
jgi:hypothetical protein